MKILNKIFGIIEYVLIVILIVYIALFIYSKYISKNGLLSIGKYSIFEIASGSMEYGLHVGDVIIVETSDTYDVGDIITYIDDDAFITHRIVSIDGCNIITKGDANNTEDSPITKSDIVGKFVRKSYVISFINKYRIVLLCIVVAYAILLEIIKLRKNN